jgi:allantoinase
MSQILFAPTVLLPDGPRAASIQITDGQIQAITPGKAPGAVDLGAVVLAPALTDTHVHINEPGRTEWEGFETATRAAAAGGVTLLVDMPLNSDPVTTNVRALLAKQAAMQGKLHVDVGLWGGVVPGNAGELRAMVEAGALGFKCFTCFSGIDEFPASTEADLRIAMPILRDAGVPLLVHAELEGPLLNPFAEADPRSYLRYLHSRPPEWEDAAVAMIIGLVRETGCRAHIVHLSSRGALPLLRAARAEGLPISAETCPHYLGLAAEEVPDGDTAFKCAPPIRERENQEALWAALRDGTLSTVVTDHSPCIPALKRLDTGDFAGAWGGIASLQLGLRSVWTAAQGRGIPLSRVIDWMSTGTAQFIGATDRGQIRVGASADLITFRPEHQEVLRAESLLHRHPTSPWVGRMLSGEITRTWMRGTVIAEEGRPLGQPLGRSVRTVAQPRG